MTRTPAEERQLTRLARRLVQAREDAGFESLEKVEKRCGIAAHTIRSYERGRFVPSALKLAQLAKLYKVQTDWLLGMPKARRNGRR